MSDKYWLKKSKNEKSLIKRNKVRTSYKNNSYLKFESSVKGRYITPSLPWWGKTKVDNFSIILIR